MVVGLSVLIAAYPMLRWFRREFPNGPRRTPRLIVLIFVTSGLLLMWFFSPIALLPREVSCDYFGTVRFDAKNRVWVLRGELVAYPETDEKILHPATGWEAGGGVDRNPSFENERHISAMTVWYQAKTINKISFPELFTRFDTTQGYFFPRLTDKSKIELIAPKYSIGQSYPAFEQRADMLDGNEQVRIPVQFTFDTVPELRIELVNPILRNFVGAAILTGVAWSPFKWLVLAFFGVIGDQIKKRYLARAARNLFRRFRVIYGHRKTRVKTRRRLTVA